MQHKTSLLQQTRLPLMHQSIVSRFCKEISKAPSIYIIADIAHTLVMYVVEDTCASRTMKREMLEPCKTELD